MLIYAIKYPRTDWSAVENWRSRRWWRSRRRAEEYVERAYAPGYTREPYVQLVAITADAMRVIAEWDVRRREWAHFGGTQ